MSERATNANRLERAGVLTPGTVLLVVVAGVIGEIILEIIAWGVFPALIGRPMRPDLLLATLGQTLLGIEMGVRVAVAIHLILGAFIMPLIYVWGRETLGMRSWLLAGALWGLILWATAQMILAPLAGRPFMLGFIPYTWGSLVGHVVYMVTVAFAFERLSQRFPDLRSS